MRSLFLVLLLVFLSAGLARGAARVRIGVEFNSPPLSFANSQGQPDGFTRELLQEMERTGGVEFEILPSSWTYILGEFNAGRLDALANVAITDARRATMDFTIGHASIHGVSYTRSGGTPIRHTSQFAGKIMATLQGSIADTNAQKHGGWGAKIVVFGDWSKMLQAVQRGECDFALLMRTLKFEQPDEFGLRRDHVDDIVHEFHIAVHRGDRETLEPLNEALATVRHNGAFDRIYNKWIGPIEPHPIRLADLRPYLLPGGLSALLIVGLLLWQRRVNRRLARQARALQESEAKFAKAFHRAPMMISITAVEDGRFIEVNDFALKVSGFSREEVVGSTTTGLSWITPTIREKLTGALRLHGRIDGLELPFRAKDGRIIHGLVSGELIVIGGQTALLTVTADITERKQVEAALQRAEERFRAIFENAVEGIYQSTPEGRIITANPAMARILGYRSPEDLIHLQSDLGRHGYVNPEDRQEFKRRIEAHGSVNDFEYEAWRQDRTKVWVSDSARVVRDSAGAVSYYEGFMSDITEQKRTEDERAKLQSQLTQAQKMESIGRLAGGVAHDFNNMLTAIQVNAALALEDLAPGSALHESLEQIQQCANRSALLTSQLLAFARKQTVSPKVIDLNATVEGTLKMLRRLIGEDIHLVWRPAAGLWSVKIDPSQIDQLLANLCVNARDAIAGMGRITLETGNVVLDEASSATPAGFAAGDYVRLAISDNGSGMDPETLAHLFEPFFTTKAVGRGTGLGLATVYGMLKQNGGFIDVDSEPGRGTTFKVYLPRHADQTIEPRAEAAAPPAKTGHETILLVEDEPAILWVGRRMLENLGYKILAAGAPGEALRLAQAHAGEIHLLLTDVVMPEMNGRDLATRLLSLHPNLKTVFMSGYTANIIAPGGELEAGIHFIQKPFLIKELAEKVREALAAD